MKKKILYLSDSPHIDGSGKALYNIVGSMSEKFEILIIFPRYGLLIDELEKINVNYKLVNFYLSIYPTYETIRDKIMFIARLFKKLYINKKAISKIEFIINDFKPDLIHTNVGPLHIGYLLGKKLNIPHIWHIREYQDLYFGWRPIFSMKHFIRKLKHTNNHIISISKGIQEHYQLDHNSIVIYDGVFNSNSTPTISYNKEKYFLFVGRLEEGKGVIEIISAFAKFAKKDNSYKLYIAGTGNSIFENSLKQYVFENNLDDQIIFLGFRKDVNYLMSKATALIVSSRFEGFGFITAEAMYNGCLVIGKNTAGTKEQFDNGLIRHGKEIGLRYTDEKELVIYLHEITNNGIEYYTPMLKRAQETVVNLYSIEQNVEKIYMYYKDIII